MKDGDGQQTAEKPIILEITEAYVENGYFLEN